MVLAASLVAQEDLLLRGAQAAAFAALAWLVQPRLRLRRTAAFLAATVVFNLLTPAGRVLLRVGGVAITEGALMVGAGKAAGLGGLLFVSRLMVDPRLRLPGTAGALFGSTMAYLARLMDNRVRFRLRSPIRSLDRALLAAQTGPADPEPPRAPECGRGPEPGHAPEPPRRPDALPEPAARRGSGATTPAGAACVAAVLVLCGCAVAWGRLRGRSG